MNTTRRAFLAGLPAAALVAAPMMAIAAEEDRTSRVPLLPDEATLQEAMRLAARLNDADLAALAAQVTADLSMRLRAGAHVRVLPGEAMRESDPAFAAIDRHNTAWHALTAGAQPDEDAARRRYQRNWRALQRTVPTTPAGAAAAIRFVVSDVENGAEFDREHLAILANALRALPTVAAAYHSPA